MTTAAKIARIHMELASPTCDRALVTDLLGTFTTRTSANQLAATTADAIRAKLPYTNVTIPIRGRPAMTAWWILNMPDDTTQILDELSTDALAAVCIALLAIWCDACDAATETALAGLGGTDWGSVPRLSDFGADLAPRPVTDVSDAAGGRTAKD